MHLLLLLISCSYILMTSTANAEGSFVYTTGENTVGQRATNSNLPASLSPSRVHSPLENLSVKKISAGAQFTLALTTDGQVYAWGDNSEHQLGVESDDDDQDFVTVPTLVEAFKGQRIVDIAACVSHSLAVDADSVVYSWGSGANTLGTNEMTHEVPTAISFAFDSTVEHVSCGKDHSIALTKLGTVYSWGNSLYGVLGHNATVTNIPHKIPDFTASMVSSGLHHVIALHSVDGDVYVWGRND